MKLQLMIDKSCKSIMEISKESGVSRQSIYNILAGNKSRRYTYAKLARTLNCNVEDIMD